MNYVFDVDGTLSFNGTSISAEITKGLKTLKKWHWQIRLF